LAVPRDRARTEESVAVVFSTAADAAGDRRKYPEEAGPGPHRAPVLRGEMVAERGAFPVAVLRADLDERGAPEAAATARAGMALPGPWQEERQSLGRAVFAPPEFRRSAIAVPAVRMERATTAKETAAKDRAEAH
jgi:hypothetical protein